MARTYKVIDADGHILEPIDQVARTLPSAGMNGRKASTRAARTIGGRRTLKCPRCDRRFARPVHLGRHLSATHGRKKKAA